MEVEIDDVLDEAELDPEIKSVMLRGAGSNFTAGHDIRESAAARESVGVNADGSIARDRWGEVSRPRTLPRAWYFRKPLIAGVHGFVGPYGVYLAACCDFIIAAEGTRFDLSMYRTSGGGAPGWEAVTFYQQFPMRVVEKLCLFGGWLGADEALQFQFVQRVVALDEVERETKRWAEYAASLLTTGFSAGKEQIRRVYEIMGVAWMEAMQPRTLTEFRDGDANPFWKLIREKGLKEATRLRDAQFDDDVARV
jgi:enoyl-CoA hydratase